MTMLAGKHILITGAGRGLGQAYARASSREGARLTLMDVDAEAMRDLTSELNLDGGAAVSFTGSVSKWADCEAAIEVGVDAFGPIHGLVNNAAVMETTTTGSESEEHVRRHFEVNVFGSYFMFILAVPHMPPGSSIVNVTSAAHAGLQDVGAYAGSKGAIASLTYSWAAGLVEAGVRVNAIAPHADTAMLRDALPLYTRHFGGNSESPAPSLNAPVVVFLLSDLSRGLNGQILRIADGRDLMFMARPALLAPGFRHETWTPEAIRDAIDQHLVMLIRPPGRLEWVEQTVIAPDTAVRAFEANTAVPDTQTNGEMGFGRHPAPDLPNTRPASPCRTC